jgi:hypothetical protein
MIRLAALSIYAAIACAGEALVARPALLWARGLAANGPGRAASGPAAAVLAVAIAATTLLLAARSPRRRGLRLRLHGALLVLAALALTFRALVAGR